MPPLNALQLPRPLVNQLLHYAQSAPDRIRWGLIGSRDRTPMHCYPLAALDAAHVALARQQFELQGETLFATFRSGWDVSSAPDLPELSALGIRAPLLLGISLGIKGVLQLRGWRTQAGKCVPLEISISET